MENFQLYKTNVLLGGQLKWDLILDTVGDAMEVVDMHLASISPAAPQIKYSDENLLNYSHQENVRTFYKNNMGHFYNECLDAKLSHNWPIIDDKIAGTIIKESSYDAGACIGKYSLYNKSIEVFCPLWLEHIDGELEFNIVIEVSNGELKKRMATKRVKLGPKFKTYLYNYFEYIGLNSGNDDVLNINFDKKIASIYGLSVESGNVCQLDISEITYNMLYRERPLMESDYMLINEFANKKLIAKQLFNFSFYFNIEDVLSQYLSNMVYGKDIIVKIETIVNGNVLEMRDFYSNYQFIPKKNLIRQSITNILDGESYEISGYNVLDYLADYKCTNLVNKNKYVQSIIHWSLLDNYNYIFNVYDGFGGIIDKHATMSHNYGFAPDTTNDIYNEFINNIGWCSVYNITSAEWDRLMSINNKYDYNYIKQISTDLKLNWVNDLKYKDLDWSVVKKFKDWNEFKCAIFICDSNTYSHIKSLNWLHWTEISNGVGCSYVKPGDEFFGVFVEKTDNDITNLNKVTFKGFKQLLDDMKLSDSDPLFFIRHKLEKMIQVSLISIDKSLYVKLANSPSMLSNEVEYFKNDSGLLDVCYVLRYDGKIKPTFIKESEYNMNSVYGKRIYTEDEYSKTDFSKYSKSGFSPEFPSIGYCSWREVGNYSKFNTPIKILKQYINTELYAHKNEYIDDKIIDYLMYIYNTDVITAHNIKSKYNISYNYDYKSLTDIDNYIYKISMVLK